MDQDEKGNGPLLLDTPSGIIYLDGKLYVTDQISGYIHVYQDGGIRCLRPASGLTTALDPVMRACGGVWVAHGSGSGDRQSADAHARLVE